MTFKEHCETHLGNIEAAYRRECRKQYIEGDTPEKLILKLESVTPLVMPKYEGEVTEADKAFWQTTPKPDFKIIRWLAFQEINIPTKERRAAHSDWYAQKGGYPDPFMI